MVPFSDGRWTLYSEVIKKDAYDPFLPVPTGAEKNDLGIPFPRQWDPKTFPPTAGETVPSRATVACDSRVKPCFISFYLISF